MQSLLSLSPLAGRAAASSIYPMPPRSQAAQTGWPCCSIAVIAIENPGEETEREDEDDRGNSHKQHWGLPLQLEPPERERKNIECRMPKLHYKHLT